ncbi:hypothetical protein [Persicobacter diffluens]|uniref:Uncharacterized protein n=1 Tax=Persicobacter diffluens TaxID=981 RepID=A0AAN4VZT8_9BACT|nr:hypothetical protein PEDI_23820 [Persicobacter diffluens]
MSEIAKCPTCGSTSRIKTTHGEIHYQAVQDDDALKKIGQMKKALEKYKSRIEELEAEVATLKSEH